MPDYRVKVSVRNARLMRAFESICYTPTGFAKAYGFPPNEVCDLAAMRIKPTLANGEWRKCVVKLCDLVGKMPSELFTDRQMEGLRANSTQREVGEGAILAMLAPPATPEQLAITSDIARIANEVIDGRLSPRYAKVMRMFADGASLSEIGEEIGVSRGRAHQMVMKAQRQTMAHMARRGVKSLEGIL